MAQAVSGVSIVTKSAFASHAVHEPPQSVFPSSPLSKPSEQEVLLQLVTLDIALISGPFGKVLHVCGGGKNSVRWRGRGSATLCARYQGRVKSILLQVYKRYAAGRSSSSLSNNKFSGAQSCGQPTCNSFSCPAAAAEPASAATRCLPRKCIYSTITAYTRESVCV